MNRSTALLVGLGVVLVAALWWLFLYSPGQEELATIEEEIVAAEAEQVSLEARVVALEAVRARAPETEAAIARVRSVVPEDPDLPGALRQLQAAADDAGLTIQAVATNRPAEFDELLGLYSAGITITADGSYFQVVDFVRRVEDPAITARGVLMRDVTLASIDYPTLTVSLQADMFSVLEPPPSPDDEVPAPAAEDEADEAEEEAA